MVKPKNALPDCPDNSLGGHHHYDRPRDLRYFFVFLSPILDAFFFTASSGRPNLAAILAVGLFGKSFLSNATSLFDHKPLTSFFFAIVQFLSPNWTFRYLLTLLYVILSLLCPCRPLLYMYSSYYVPSYPLRHGMLELPVYC